MSRETRTGQSDNLTTALETTEDVQDPLNDRADEVLILEADTLLAAHGRER